MATWQRAWGSGKGKPVSSSGVAGRMRMCLLLALAVLVLGVGTALAATTWTVDRTTDSASDGSGTTGSLRWAVAQAQNGDTIQFADGLANQTIALNNFLTADKSLAFTGPASGPVTINGYEISLGVTSQNPITIGANIIFADLEGMVEIANGAVNIAADFSGNTNTDGGGYGYTRGGGVAVTGSVTGSVRGVISGNLAESTPTGYEDGAFGGGIYVSGDLNDFAGRVTNNLAAVLGSELVEAHGGGIHADSITTITGAGSGDTATGRILRNTVRAESVSTTESASARGGGIFLSQLDAPLTITDATINLNTVEATGTNAVAEGGAIFVDTGRSAAPQIILNTTSGNAVNINFNKAIVNGVEKASGIHFGRYYSTSQANASLTIQGAGNTYMMDPVTVDLNNGKTFTMTKTGNGGFNWGGGNVLDAAGGSTVTLGSSTQFYSGFSMDNGGTNTTDNVIMNLNGGGAYYQVAALNTTAASTDALTFTNTTLNLSNTSFLIPYGLLQLGDNSVLNVGNGSGITLNGEGTLKAIGNSRINGGGLSIGAGETLAVDLGKTLTLDAANTLAFNGGTLSVGVGSGNASGKIVSLNTTTAPDFSGSNTLNISEWIPGSYTVLEAEAAMAAGAPGTFTSFTVGGNTVDPSAYSLSAALSGGNKSLLVNAALNQDSSLKTWGGASGTWNYTNTNWLPGTSVFILGDLALFDGTNAASGLTVSVGDGAGTTIETSGMSITDGSYTFSGGKIVGKTGISQGSVITATGLLEIAGSGNVVFNNAVEFEKGLTVTALRTAGILANPDVTLADYSGGKIVLAVPDPLHRYEGNFSGKVNISGISESDPSYLSGGGMRIHSASQSRVDILQGSLIENNELTVTNTTSGYGEAMGGGIYANYLGTVAGTISGNKATVTTDDGPSYAEGGGLHVTDRVEEISGLVSGNVASVTSNGGSNEIQVRGGGVFTSGTSSEQGIRLLSGTVENNRAEATGGTGSQRNMAYGGGVYGFMPFFTGIVAGNTAKAVAADSRQAWAAGGGINSFNVTELAGDVTGNLAEADATSGAMAYALGGGAYISFMSGVNTTTISKGTYSGNKVVAKGTTSFAQGGGLFVDTFQPFNSTDIVLMLDPQRGAVTFEDNAVWLNSVKTANGIHFGRSPKYDGSQNDSTGNAVLEIKDSAATGNLITIADGIVTDINNGKAFTLAQSGGEFLWGGPNLFDSAGGDAVALSGGQMHLMNGFSLDRGATNGGTGLLDFKVTGGNLRSEGAAAALNNTALSVSGGTLTVDLGSTLTLDAASTFSMDSGTLSVGVGPSNASGTIVSLNTTTAPAFTGTNTLDITDLVYGDYTLVRAAAAMDAAVPGTFTAFTVGGNPVNPAVLRMETFLAGQDKELLLTAAVITPGPTDPEEPGKPGGNAEAVWSGASGAWNYTDANWTANGETHVFLPKDAALFDGAGGTKRTVTLGGTSINPSGVRVTGSADYTLTGAALYINSAGAAGDVVSNTVYRDKLVMDGTGVLTLDTGSEENPNRINAVEINSGVLALGDGFALEPVSGRGSLLGNGGALQLEGTAYFTNIDASLTNAFSLGSDNALVMANSSLDRGGAALNVSGGAALVSASTGNSLANTALNLDGGKLTVDLGSTLTLDAASTFALNSSTLSIGVGASNTSGLIDMSANTTTAPTFAGSNTMDISQWLLGEYTVLTAGKEIAAGAPGTFSAFTVGGNALGAGISISPSLSGDGKSLIVTASLGRDNAEVAWGGVSGAWNYTDYHWTLGGHPSYFLPGDAALFNSASNQAVTLGGDSVSLSGMKVTGAADYTLSGAALHIDSASAQNLVDPGYADNLLMESSGTLLLQTGASNHNRIAGDVVATDGILALGDDFALTHTGAGGVFSLNAGTNVPILDIRGAARIDNMSLQLVAGASELRLAAPNSSLTVNHSGASYLGLGVMDVDLNRSKTLAALTVTGGGHVSLDQSTLRLRHTGLVNDAGSWLIIDGDYLDYQGSQNSGLSFQTLEIATATLEGALRNETNRIFFDGTYTVAGTGPGEPFAGFSAMSTNARRAWPGFQDAFYNKRTPFMNALELAYNSPAEFQADLPRILNESHPEGAVSQGLYALTAHNAAAVTALGHAFPGGGLASGQGFAPLAFQASFNGQRHSFDMMANGRSRRDQAIATARYADRMDSLDGNTGYLPQSYSVLANWQPASDMTRTLVASASPEYTLHANGPNTAFGVRVWGGYFGDFARQDKRGGYAGYDADHNGFLLGGSFDINPNWTVGAYAGWTTGETRYTGIRTRIETDATHIGAFARYKKEAGPGTVKVTGDVIYSFSDNDSRRTVPTALGDQRMKGSFDQNIYGGGLELAYDWSPQSDPATVLTPFLSARYSHLEQDGFTESGNLALKVGSADADSFTTSLGLTAARDFSVNDAVILTPKATLGWRHQWADDTVDARTSFVGSPVTFMTRSVKQDKDAALVGVGLDILIRRESGWDMGLKFGYGADISKNGNDQNVFAGFEIKF